MHEDLVRLVNIAGKALEAEDRVCLSAIAANQIAYPNGNGGILRINKEHHYQFIVARALTSSFHYPIEVEKNWHDLVVTYPGDPDRWFAIVEMKLWMSEGRTFEIPGINHDIDVKLATTKAEHNLMLIFSANPREPGKTKKNLGSLAKQLELVPNEDPTIWESYIFPTIDKHGDEVEFWVAGYEVEQSVRPYTANVLSSAG